MSILLEQWLPKEDENILTSTCITFYGLHSAMIVYKERTFSPTGTMGFLRKKFQ